jgi:RNA polymerase sigma factor (sigma-70 family)
MDDTDYLARRFEEERTRLRGVAYRMLGSAAEADDAVQEAWLRLSRTDADTVENLPAWLTTVVSRVCLNVLRSRTSRREQPLDLASPTLVSDGVDPEQEALLADSVGLALLVVLNMLSPAERLAFVLHDMFDLPFDEIAPIVGKSSAATRQLASRARRRVRGGADSTEPDLARQRRVVEAYRAAAARGDIAALVALLDPDVELRADAAAVPSGLPMVLHGADAVVRGAVASGRRAPLSEPALVNGRVGLVLAVRGQLAIVLDFTLDDETITAIDVIADAERLDALQIGVLA